MTDQDKDKRYELYGSDFEPTKCSQCVTGGPFHTACFTHGKMHCTADWCF